MQIKNDLNVNVYNNQLFINLISFTFQQNHASKKEV